MLVILLIFVVGLAPAAISAYCSVRDERAAKRGDQGNHAPPANAGIGRLRLGDGDGDLHYVDGLGYMIGDITCDLNARSPYLRCAINPFGPCDGCSTYAPKVFDRQV